MARIRSQPWSTALLWCFRDAEWHDARAFLLMGLTNEVES
jgi:hypothetical protein